MRPALSAPLWGLLALLAAVPLRAGVPEAVNETILPGYEASPPPPQPSTRPPAPTAAPRR